MSPSELKISQYFETLMILVEKTSKSKEDSILLAGAMSLPKDIKKVV